MLLLTPEQFTEQHGAATERRVELAEQFRQWLAIARATQALRRVWVFGSFVTGKPGPGDLDILAVFAAGFDVAQVPAQERHWFDHELCRELHEIDLFRVTESAPPETLALILSTFGVNRTGENSMVEIAL